MENNSKDIVVQLNPYDLYQFELAGTLRNFAMDSGFFYHIYVEGDILTIHKEGYNTPPLESIRFDMSELIENDQINQKRAVIELAYMYIFHKTGDLKNRVDVIEENGSLVDTHEGSQHAFYHDRTGQYPEGIITKNIKRNNPYLFDNRRFGIHK